MADKIRYEVDVDSSDAKRGLQEFSRAAKQAGKEAAGALDDTATAGERARTAIKQMATVMDAQLRDAAKAADALATALGPELTGRIDVESVVQDLNKMGVSFEEITADADKFATTLREVDGVRVDQVSDGIGHVKSNTDEFSDSAKKARNASANMFGNAAQDLGALVGLSGSAGVALGQLAEGAADAANEGEGLGSVFKGVAGSAGPIVALAAVTFAATKALEAYGAKSKVTAAATAASAKAILEQSDAVNQLNNALANLNQGGPLTAQQQFLTSLFDKPEEINKTSAAMDVLGISMDALGPIFNAIEADSHDAFVGLAQSAIGLRGPLDDTALQLAELMGSAVNTTEDATSAFETFKASAESIGIPDDVINSYQATVAALEQINDAQQNTDVNDVAQQQLLYAEALGAVNKNAREALDLAKQRAGPDASNFDIWTKYVEIINRLKTAFAGLNPLIEQNAADQEQVKAIGEAITTGFTDQTAAIADSIKAWKDHSTAVQEAAIDIGNVLDEIPDVASAIGTEFGKIDDVISGLKFDVDFQPAINTALHDLGGFKPDFQTLADQWSNILAGKPIDLFGNVRADDSKFLDLFKNLSDLFHTGAVNAFQQGGTEAANTFVQSAAAEIAASTGLSIEDVYKVMGLPPDGSIATLIEPEVDKTHADQARAILDALAPADPGDACTARIHVALETGAIDGDIAFIASQLLAHDALGIPVDLSQFTQADVDQAQAFLDGQIWTASIVPQVPTVEQNRTDQTLTTLAAPRTATIDTEAPDADETSATLDGVATGVLSRIWPGGKGRVATYHLEAPGAGDMNTLLNAIANPGGQSGGRLALIVPYVDPSASQNAQATLNNIANPGGQARTAHINVVRTGGGGATSGGGGTAGGQSATTLAAGPTATANATASPLSASPTVFAAAPAGNVFNANVTINTGVLGNHFDVERTVTRALRRHQRVNGTRS